MGKSYSEKLKDPRWQKKRLEIFERDGWMCQACQDTETTLHVHHKRYFPGRNPWDYANDLLITLCEDCHREEREMRGDYEADLLSCLRALFSLAELEEIVCGFIGLSSPQPRPLIASALSWTLRNDEQISKMIDSYIVYCREKNAALREK